MIIFFQFLCYSPFPLFRAEPRESQGLEGARRARDGAVVAPGRVLIGESLASYGSRRQVRHDAV